MTQSTYFNQVKNVLKVLQGYTKGIRFIALLTMLCTIGVGQMWGAEVTLSSSTITSGKKLAYASEWTYTANNVSWSGFTYTDANNRPWIQLKNDKGVYVKIVTPSGSKITQLKVTITSASNSSGGVTEISKHTNFSGRVALLKEDAAGSANMTGVAYTTTVSNDIATLNPSGNDNTLYLKVSSGARIWSMTVTYETAAAVTYKVTYNANGATSGTAPTDATSYTSGTTVTVKSNSGNLAKTGYTFGGWNTKSDGTGTNYTAGSGTFTITANTTLYAKWNTATKYTVTLVPGSGSVASTTLTETSAGAGVTLPEPTLDCGDWEFAGWATSVVATETSTKPTLIAAGTYDPTANTTLYAVYQKTETTQGGGSGNYELVTSAPTDWSGTYLIVDGSSKNCFNGSLTALDAGGNYESVTISDNTITSNTTTDSYSVTISKSTTNGKYYIKTASGYYIGSTASTSSDGNELKSSTSTKYDNSISINSNNVTIKGPDHILKFFHQTNADWRFRYYKSTTTNNVRLPQLYKKSSGSSTTTYYHSTPDCGVQAPDTYLLTWNLDGGSITEAGTAGGYVEMGTALKAPIVTKDGYIFIAWDPAIPNQMPEQDVTYTAQWKANSYSIAFNSNGGNGSIANQEFTYDTPQNISSNSFTKDGYIFVGWNTANDGSGISYTDGQSVENLTTTNNETITLYAQWKQIYTVNEAWGLIDGGTPPAEKVYVRGRVSNIEEISTTYGNATYYITDFTGEKSLYVFRGKYLNNAKFSSEEELKLNDVVVIYGTLYNYDGTYEIKENYLISISSPTALQTPTGMQATPGEKQVVLSWEEVEHATSYTVIFNGTPYAGITSTSTTITNLIPSTTYTWTVKAIGDGENYSDSNPCGEQSVKTSESTAPILFANPTSIDYGTVAQNASIDSKTFTINGSYLTSGNLTISATEGYTVSPTTISVDGTLNNTTITVTPNTTNVGTFNGNVTIEGGGLEESVVVALSMQVKPVYTITWNVGGATSTTTVVDGAAVELPENPSSCSDKYTTFVGWYTQASGMESNPSATPQGEKITASTIPTGDATYYAVWADGSGAGGEQISATIDFSENTWSFPTEYTTTEQTYTDGNYSIKLAGTSDGYKYNANQILLGKSGAYMELPAFPFKVSKIVAVEPSGSVSGRVTWNVYSGENEVSTEVTGCTSGGTFEINENYQTIGTIYTIKVTNANNLQIKKLNIYESVPGATGYISYCCQSPAVVSVTPANANLELNIDGTASTTVNISQTGGGNGKYYAPTVSPMDGASLDWAALGVTYKQTAYDINFTATKAGTYTVTGNFTETAAGCSKTGSATITVAANPILQVSEPNITSECGTEGMPVAVTIDSRYLTGSSLTAQIATTTDTEHGVFKICTTEDGDFATTDLTGLSAGKDDKATVTIYIRYDAALDNIDAATGTLTITDGTTSQTIDLATTPICGTSIRMTPTDANSVRVTTANGQWTRTQTPIHLRGSYLLQNLEEGQGAKVELTSSNSNFKFVKPDVASSGTVKYESDKITINTWEADVYLVYTPTAHNQNETTTITAKVITFGGTTEHASATLTAYGRSFPETFVLALNTTGNEWVALPADMIAPYGGCETGVGTHDPYPITVDNDVLPTEATLAPARAVYKGAARNTPETNPWTIQFESNTQVGYYLFGSKNENTTIANTDQQTGEGVKWALTTEDNVTYQLSQTTTTNGQKLGYNGTKNTMGQYQSAASNYKYNFRILPVTSTCTYYIEPIMTLVDYTDEEAIVRIQYDGTNLYQISTDNKANWANIEGEIDCQDLTFTLNSSYRGKDVWLKPQGDLCEEVVSSVSCHIPAPVITNPGSQEFKGTKNTDFAGVFTITGTDLYKDVSAIYIKANSNPAIGVAINNGEVIVRMNAPAVGTYTTNLTFDAVGTNEVTVPVTIEIQDLATQEFDGGNGAFVEADGVSVLCKNLIDGGITPEIYLSYSLFYEGNGINELSQLNNTSFSLVEIETGDELSIKRGVPSEFNASVTFEATTLSKMIPGHTYRLSWENTNQVMTNAIGLPYMDCYMDFVYSENCDAPTALLACPITNSGFTANWVPKADCSDNVTVEVYTRGAETTLIEKTSFDDVNDLKSATTSENVWITNIKNTNAGAPSISSNRLLISDVSTPIYYNLFSPLLSNLGSINESIIYTITITLYQANPDAGAGAYFYVMDNGSSLTKNTTPNIEDKTITIDGQTATYKKLTSGTTTFTVKGLSSDDRIRFLGFETSSIASDKKNVYISSITIEASGSITPIASKTVACNAGSAEFTGLTSNTQYYYTVTDGSSNTSNEIAVTTYSGEQSLVFYSDQACTENITETLVLGGEETTVYVSGTYVPGCEINTAVSSGYGMDDSGLIYVPTTGSVTGSIVLSLSDVNTTEGTLTLTDGKGNAYVLNINSSNCPTGFGSMALAASNINKTTATANWNNALNFGSPKYGTLHLYKNGEVNVEKIVNGDFETGSLEQGWSNTIHTGEGYQDVDAFETYIVKTNNDAHEGGSYLYVSEEGSGNKYDDFHDMPILYADYVDLLPGRYQMKAWAKMKPANEYPDKQQQFALGLISGDKNSRTIVCKSETMLVTSNNTYVELTYEFELQSIVRACPVIGVKRDAGDFIPFYIDDVSLKRIKCPERGDEVKTIDIADLSAESSLDLTDLTPATEYTYVIQNAADCSSNEITFATDYSAIVQVHFSEDGTITSVPVDAETHKVTFEPTQSCAGRIFVGWSRDLVALTQTEPVGLVDLENETFTETTLLYAVYKSANGGKGNGISQVAFTEQFTGLAKYDTQNQNTVKTVQTQYTEWEYCYGRTRESSNANSLLGHVDLMFYGTSSTHKNTQAYLRTTQKIEGLSQLSLYARVNSNIGNTFHVQVSEDGINWKDVVDRIMPGKDYTQYIITLPTPIDAYIRIITTPVNSFASDATLNIDDIEIQTQARQFFYSDYATTCEGATSVAMTFDLNGGTAPVGKESDYEPKTTANTWHTLPAAPKKGDVPFLGWKVIDVSGYEMTFDAGEKYLLNHNVTLQAQWPTTEGDLMDIVDWNTNSITINMNGYTISPSISYAVNGGETNTLVPENQNTRYSFQHVYDRTYDITTPTLTPGEYLQLSVTMGSDHSNQYYQVPYIYSGNHTLPTTLTRYDQVVVRDGCLTIDGAVQVNTIYVYPTAELRIAEGATLTANKIYMRTNAFQSAVLTDNGTLNVGQLYYTRIVADKQNSFLMALPFESTIADMRLTTGETKTYNKQWVLYTYDAAQRAQTGATGNNWVKQSSITSIQPYTSYELLSGSAYYREYCFPVAYTKTNANVDISVTAHTGAAAQADPIHGGWNAIASPYTQNIQPQWGAPEEAIKLTRLLDDNKTYYQYVPTIIEPATAFYYQTAQTANLQFTTTTLTLQTPQAVAAKVAQREETDYPTQWINIVLSKQNDCQDQTNIYIHPDKFVTDYETAYDLTKMMGYGNRAQCYTTMPCGKLSFNALPLPVATNGINMGIYAPQTETLTLSITPNNYIQNVEQILLQDHYTNQTTDLLHTPYSFVAQPGEDEERFTIFIKCSATAITTDNAAQHNSQAYAYTQPKKLFLANLPRSGNIVIYDAVGKQIVQQRITQTNMDFVLPTGNYYVKVVNESEVQIIPTIVK